MAVNAIQSSQTNSLRYKLEDYDRQRWTDIGNACHLTKELSMKVRQTLTGQPFK